ncbi:GAF and ANTAR domain-containing protein [Nocardioides KLBMP 9356]|uniref:GAF and ANTAR domain-containing protein n=1 Tax=Nocardioides potassii TaxID=2911371 RepID=A0ABS9H841_9ACTN|nr:GAF and ANTAR domain-containing protein [Nocardioides potassii]MCF6377381.1 GAF and ANTAR domain-containing protein [Nocardioides potassii]
MDSDGKLAEQVASSARSLEAEPDPQSTMEMAVQLAVTTIDGCDAAGITLVGRGSRLSTPAYSDDNVLACDLLQYELREGPCLDATWDEPVVHSPDLLYDARWPAWAPRVARDHHARSMLCLRLFTEARTIGALNLYASAPGSFEATDHEEAYALAALVAIALAESQELANLARALDTRTVIGQACGILMERFDIGDSAAFKVLARVSSQSNVRVGVVAQEFVTTRRLAGVPDREDASPDH